VSAQLDKGFNGDGEKFTVTITGKPGTYPYSCPPHEGAGMVGKIIVE
jgi:plastocyanin